jgi:hypothetical protein
VPKQSTLYQVQMAHFSGKGDWPVLEVGHMTHLSSRSLVLGAHFISKSKAIPVTGLGGL